MKPRIIGLGFRARSGKDSVADFLVDTFGGTKKAFAKPLKDSCNIIFGWDDRHAYGELKEVVDPYWGFTPRWAYQIIGTQGVRNLVGKDTWVKSMKRRLQLEGHLDEIFHPTCNLVFTDVRFPEEATLIKELGGECWHIHRPSLGPLPDDAHDSERAMLNWKWDLTILNEGTLDELKSAARNAWNDEGQIA